LYPVSYETGFFLIVALHQLLTSYMQKSTKIAWTIVTLLIGGIVLWNLEVGFDRLKKRQMMTANQK